MEMIGTLEANIHITGKLSQPKYSDKIVQKDTKKARFLSQITWYVHTENWKTDFMHTRNNLRFVYVVEKSRATKVLMLYEK